MVSKIESLAEAISHYAGYDEADSATYQARNPISLKAFSPRHMRDTQNNRVFRTAVDGWQAAFFDLNLKASGKSKSGLKPTSSLKELVRVYGLPEAVTTYVVRHLRKALADPTLHEATPLGWFIEE